MSSRQEKRNDRDQVGCLTIVLVPRDQVIFTTALAVMKSVAIWR